MELVLFVSLLLPALWQSQNQTDADLPVEVVKFSWSLTRAPVPDDHRPGGANPARREYDYLREMANRSSVEERSRDMRELEENVARVVRQPGLVDLYRYSIELKNRGSKVIKWVFVDYQTSEPSDPDNPSDRQFACSVTIKPYQSKLLEGFSNLPPNRVVSATNPNKPLTERLIINRIEYDSGEIWQRPDWHAPDKIPNGRAIRGQCRPF